MEFPLASSFNVSSAAYVRFARDYPHIRMFTAGINTSASPLLELNPAPHIYNNSNASICNGGICGVAQVWAAPSPTTLPFFSAVCFWFGKSLADNLGPNHPIGLLASNLGGTRDEAWSTPVGLASCNVGGTEKPESGTNNVSVLYNAMIHPLFQTTITGAIWYQVRTRHHHLHAWCLTGRVLCLTSLTHGCTRVKTTPGACPWPTIMRALSRA